MNDEQKLIEMYRTLNKAMVQADIKTLDDLLADDFTLTHITGYVQPKQEWLSEVRSGSMAYGKTEEVSVNAEVNGAQGKIVGRTHTTANIRGAKGTWPLQQSIDVSREQGQWKMTKAVATLF